MVEPTRKIRKILLLKFRKISVFDPVQMADKTKRVLINKNDWYVSCAIYLQLTLHSHDTVVPDMVMLPGWRILGNFINWRKRSFFAFTVEWTKGNDSLKGWEVSKNRMGVEAVQFLIADLWAIRLSSEKIDHGDGVDECCVICRKNDLRGPFFRWQIGQFHH